MTREKNIGYTLMDMPREKMVKNGPQALSDVELIAILLGTGSQHRSVLQLSEYILDTLPQNPADWTVDKLESLNGIGIAKYTKLLASYEWGRRHLDRQHTRIQSPQDVLPLLTNYIKAKQEHLICISLNGAGEVIESRVVTVGLVNQTQVHPREVFADAIADRATSIILAHNHPSGSLVPSDDDIQVTKRLCESGIILGIQIYDHIIVSSKGYYSFLEQCML